MKFKKSSLKSVSIIFFVVCILFITGSLAVVIDEKVKVDSAIKYDNKVKTNNSFFELQWDFDTTGYGADGLFYLKSSNFKTLDKNRSVYVGLLFPALISNNNKIFIEQKENVKQTTQKSVFCDTAKYGWQVFNQQIWCNSTQTKFNNVTLLSESYDIKTLYDVTSDNYLISTTNNLTVFYNTTTITEQFIKRDLSLSLINTEDKDIKTYVKKLNKDFSDLGNNWLLVNQPINLTLGESNKIEFKIDVNRSLLPLKYSVVIIDADDNSYIIIDPTIVNARTWSNNDDFTNSTILTNVSTSATGITLTASIPLPLTQTQKDFHQYTTNNPQETKVWGVKFAITGSYNYTIKNVSIATNITTSGPPVSACIYNDSDKAEVQCGAVTGSGNDWLANFNYILNTGKTYWVMVHNNGSYWQVYYNNSDPSNQYPMNPTESYNFVKFNNSGYATYGQPPSAWTDFALTGWITILNLGFENTTSAKTHGEYSDRQGWTPQTGNQISNISITATNSSGGNIRFRHNSTNASLDTSDFTILSNGTQTLQLNLGANNNIFYQYDFNGTGTGKVVSYTINEGQAQAVTSSCTYVSGVWTVQGSEKCGLNTTAMGGNNIIFNGTGQIRILANQNITNCGVVTLQNGVDVTVTSGARLC